MKFFLLLFLLLNKIYVDFFHSFSSSCQEISFIKGGCLFYGCCFSFLSISSIVLAVFFFSVLKITKQKSIPFDKNPMEIVWSPDGSKLLVSGEAALGIIDRNQEWKLTYSNNFTHKNSITCIAWINDNVLATAGLDKQIKFWDYSAKILLNYIAT